MIVTKPGIYRDMPVETYHGDPVPSGSLSATRAKALLGEAGPARFRHLMANPVTKPAFDLGHAAHALVLGKDAERLVEVEAADWRTAAAREARDLAYKAGKTPMLPKDLRKVEDMATELSRHGHAVETLTGDAEVSMFHQLVLDGLWLRGRMDVMADGWTADYKTCADASSFGFGRAAWNLRYYMQAAWYRRLRVWLTGELLPYRIVAQESVAPYLVSVWELPDDYLSQGEDDMDEAIAIFRECTRSGKWPGYPDEIQLLTAPAWAISDEIEV